MANPEDSFTDNVPGPWYVDDQCICCGMCENLASATFRLAFDYSHHVVHRQPATPVELADAENARDRCPVEAIGRDRPERRAPAASAGA